MTFAFFDFIYEWINYNTLIVLMGASLLGACCGMVGSFAVLRRRSLTGDALAHAALPGICLGFLFAQERSLVFMLLGALLTGILGTQVIASLRRYTRIKEDAAIGIVLSVFFGVGIVLKTYIQQATTTGSKAGLDSYVMGKTAGMIASDVYLISGVALGCLLMILLFYKEMKLIAFDTGFAQSQGWPVFRLDLLLMGLIAVTVVIGLPTVGAVMIAALLIIPSAAARFWTNRLSRMLALSAFFGLLMGIFGTMLSANYEKLPAGAVIVLVGTCLFLLSVLFAPEKGILARIIAHGRFRRKLQQNAFLAYLYELSEKSLPERPSLTRAELSQNAAWSNGHLDPMIRRASQDEYLIEINENHYQLTERGLDRAAEVTRAQRLWELFLNENAELAGSVGNLASDEPEKVLPPDIIAELCHRLQKEGRLPPSPEVEVKR